MAVPDLLPAGLAVAEVQRACGHWGNHIVKTCRSCILLELYNASRKHEQVGWTTVHPDQRANYHSQSAWLFEQWLEDGAKGGYEDCPGFEDCSTVVGGRSWLRERRANEARLVENPDPAFCALYFLCPPRWNWLKVVGQLQSRST